MVERGQGVTDEVQPLKHLLETQSRLLGDYKLSSGLNSKYYFNAKPTTLSVSGIALVARVILPMIVERGANSVGGLEIGAIPISLELSRLAESQGIGLPSCIVRDAKKEHGTKELIAKSFEFISLAKRRVAVVDDVITTGKSVDQAVEALRAEGCEIACIVALVTRPEHGGITAMKARFAGTDYLSIFECDLEGNLAPSVPHLVATR